MPAELLVSRHRGRLWAAVRESGSTVELRVDSADERPGAGRIVLGRVSAVLPGMQAAFVEIGGERGALLHAADLILPDEPAPPPPIQDRLRVGRELLVQVLRVARGDKGARVTMRIRLTGRLLVLLSQARRRAVSRRIREEGERRRLQEALEPLPAEFGFVARTAAAGAEPSRLAAEARELIATWHAARRSAGELSAPATVRHEPDLLTELLRDAPAEGFAEIVLDDAGDRGRALDYLREVEPSWIPRVRLHAGPGSLCEDAGIDADVERALRPRVWLKSGGYLVIEQTEAVVSVDVNTGKYVGRRTTADATLRTNLEAAREIPRQLRLRGLGGTVVVDWVDLRRAEEREQVLATFEEELRRDRARTRIVGLSEVGLLQLTRERGRPGIDAVLTERCSTCGGSGRVRRTIDRSREPGR